MRKNTSPQSSNETLAARSGERGAALAAALLMLALLSAVALTVLAVVSTETRIAGSDLKRTQTFYASAAGIEKMTSDYSALYQQSARPTDAQIESIADAYPTELVTVEKFTFVQSIKRDDETLAAMRSTQGLTAPKLPYATLPADSPYVGLIASVTPYILKSRATAPDSTSVTLTRTMNNYLIPLFQFGMFSDNDIELHPGADFTFNGRVHANGNIYLSGLVKLFDKVTSAHELIYDKTRNGQDRSSSSLVSMAVGPTAINVVLNKGSIQNGPHLAASLPQDDSNPNWFPTSPTGTVWPITTFNWKVTSVQSANGTVNRFGSQLLTRVTGASKLELPMQLGGNPTREIIKRRLASDNLPSPAETSPLSDSRYHTKAGIRILIDDEGVTNDAAGLYAVQNGDGTRTHDGVNLSTFNPIPLPNATVAAKGGRALWRILDNNTTVDNSYSDIVNSTTYYPLQVQKVGTPQADTVRGWKADPAAPTPLLMPINTATRSPTPIKIRCNTCLGTGWQTGDKVVIAGSGLSSANNTPSTPWTITRTSANEFTLNGSPTSGSTGTPQSGGTVYSDTLFTAAKDAWYDALPKSPNGTRIPAGAGLSGHILIQIVDAAGVWQDVTKEILSMGVTVGEPNAIVQLQRPLWAAFTQGSRDSSTVSATPNPVRTPNPAYANSLTDIVNNTRIAADGQIDSSAVSQHANGFLTSIRDDTAASVQPQRSDFPAALSTSAFTSNMWNSIVPINVYNVREGRLSTSTASPNLSSDANAVYERGITNVIELNMKNLARWMDGVYNLNLLANTDAVSTNINHPDGYVVYISDRRGDNVKSMVVPNPGTDPRTFATISATNGMADNVDIYGPNDVMDPGEDVQETGQTTGTLVKDLAELPDPAELSGTSGGTTAERFNRALAVAAWSNSSNYFRRSVRLFNAELLGNTGAAVPTLSTTSGITIASENMVYTWGNYNTAGINIAPPNNADGTRTSSLNDPAKASHYMPTTTDTQVPASIVADAWFPLSKNWFDGSSAMYPDDQDDRRADLLLPTSSTLAVTAETSVRAGIIAGNNISAIAGTPNAGNPTAESRLNGGMHNFPRFLEKWNWNGSHRFNFVGSLIPLYRSTQALGQYNANASIYDAPLRNWAFDITFTDPLRLPPGTPMFQHVEPTGFRQVL